MIDQDIFLAYQWRWMDDHSPVKIIEKSRRVGLSYGEAADSVLHAADAGGGNVYYISFDKEMTQGFISDCADWAKTFGAAASSEIREEFFPDPKNPDKSICKYTLDFASGKVIHAFSSNPRNLRSKGRPRDRLVIDEAAFVDDLAELLKAAMAMTMWGGEIHLISTHNGDENPFNTLINDVRAGRYDYSLHRVTLDDALADGLYRRICQVSGQEWSAGKETAWRESLVKRYRPNEDEELFCVPAFGGGTYLPRAIVEACMSESGPLLRFEGDRAFNEAPEPKRRRIMEDWIGDELRPAFNLLDPKRRHSAGMDFARKGDMSDIVPMEIGERLDRRVPFIVEMHNVPHRQQEQALFAVLHALPRLGGVAIDAGGNGSYIAEAARDGFGSRVEGIQLSEAFYREQGPRYKALFEDRQIALIKHDDILEDHRAVRLVRGVPRVPEGKTDSKGQRHGDSYVAGLLANYASGIDAGEIDFIPLPGKPASWEGKAQAPTNFMRPPEDDDLPRIEGEGAW
ncbi:Mu-like prophage FluMu protein gp28 [Methylomagnum ishizawai]|uniref:Mu-like prophage FluMu protein gp28 n=1 Tax=Methylomagnum ishizawai TaxID=1760988 RepID=A0A1Y6CVG0_9GAMM|nr:terminase family protein [Methylomagnum ishizawai]SMF94317.1 Mu-like prophage FluMu protein gp28 [Methylomagnum ishizawai]